MEPISIPALILMGACIYVGIFHLLFFLNHRELRYNLFFSLGAFSAAAYEYFTLKIYSSQMIAESARFQAGQGLFAPIAVERHGGVAGGGSSAEIAGAPAGRERSGPAPRQTVQGPAKGPGLTYRRSGIILEKTFDNSLK